MAYLVTLKGFINLCKAQSVPLVKSKEIPSGKSPLKNRVNYYLSLRVLNNLDYLVGLLC